MRKAVVGIGLILTLAGCVKPVKTPLPVDHPASGFYQTANAFNVSGQECGKVKGSLEIRPDKIGANSDYEKVRELAPGLFIVKSNSTGKQFVTVFFLEYGLVASLPRTCSWNTEEFPIDNEILNPK